MLHPYFPNIRRRAVALGSRAFAVLQGLIQWLTGSYYTDSNGDIVDGTILDQSKQQSGYPNIASGYGLYFDGVNDGVTANSPDSSGSFTVIDYIKHGSQTGIVRTSQNRGNGGFGTAKGWQISYQQSGVAQFSNSAIDDGAGNFIAFIDNYNGIQLNTVYQIALSFDTTTGTGKIYVDGVEVLSGVNANLIGFDFTTSIYRFGIDSLGSQQFDGEWYYSKMYDQVLTEAQLQELLANNGTDNPTGLTDANLLFDYRLIEGAGTLVKDYSGNANDGTISGATWLPNIPYGQQMAFAGHNITLVSGSYINVAGTTDDATTDIDGNIITDFVYDAYRYKLPTTSVQVFDGNDDYVRLDSVPSNGDVRIVFVPDPNDKVGILISDPNDATKYIACYEEGSSNLNIVRNAGSNVAIIVNGVFLGVQGSINRVVFTNAIIFGQSNEILFKNIDFTGWADVDLFYFASIPDPFAFTGYPKLVEVVGVGKWTEANGWVDEIGSNDGTLNGSPTSEIVALTYANHATPKTGIGLDFVTDDLVDLASEGVIAGNADFTVVFQINLVNAVTNQKIIASSSSADDQIVCQATSDLRFKINGVSFDSSNFFTGTVGNVTHVAIVADRDGNASIYKNGSLVDTINISAQAAADWKYGRLGASNTPGDFLNGDLYHVSIFNSLLSAPQVLELYQNPQLSVPTGLTKADLALDLRLDDANGLIAKDYSNNANNGIINGATWIYGQQYPVKQIGLTNFNLYPYSGGNSISGTFGSVIGNNDFDITVRFIADGSGSAFAIILSANNQDDGAIKFNLASLIPYFYTNETGSLNPSNSTELGVLNTFRVRRVADTITLTLNGVDTVFTSQPSSNIAQLDRVGARGTNTEPLGGYIIDFTIDGQYYSGLNDFGGTSSLGVTRSLFYGDTDDATTDIFGNAIVDPRLESEINSPFTYHQGLVTPHRDSMNPTDGLTFAFVCEYALVNTYDVIVSKGDTITAANSIGVRTTGGDFQLVSNTATVNLGYAPALTGTHTHVVTVGIDGGYEWYIDGVLRASGATNAAPNNTQDLYRLADVNDGTEYTKAVGDQFYYNNKVTADEALSIHNFIKSTYNL